MKRIRYFIWMFFVFCLFISRPQANTMDSLQMNIYLNEEGTMNVTEIWQMYNDENTEIYKQQYNLGNMQISNFKVKDEERQYTFENNWNINDNFENKKYKYGINYAEEGIELCWGISEYGNKTYTISYDMSNAIFNTEDAQVMYLKLINSSAFSLDEFEIVIEGFKEFDLTLDVWGYGYYGRAYVSEGKIYASNMRELSDSEYAVILVKFPLNYFNTTNSLSEYNSFQEVYEAAETGSFEQDYDIEKENDFNISTFLYVALALIVSIITIIKASRSKYKFGKAGKSINMNQINAFRDIPCKKDIYRAYFVAQAYGLTKQKEDFFGAVYLKWLCDDKITFTKYDKKSLFGKKSLDGILLKDITNFENEVDQKFYNMAKSASQDSILEEKEFKKWSKSNYKKIYEWFDDAEKYGMNCYSNENLVTKSNGKYLIDDAVKNDAIELAGLKKYLKEFAYMNEKQPLEVKLWKEYLIYAQIFGMADKVADKFKTFYPEILQQIQNTGLDFMDIYILTRLSNNVVHAAMDAKTAAAAAYTGGGGGFSSGGGGGGSFGGGISGSR